jgi:hypothetical protein
MNVELLLWFIIITNIINAVCHIILGFCGSKKSENYGCGDCIFGIISLILVIVVICT